MILLEINFENLHQILRGLYDEMMPLCSSMTDVAKGIAGLGALFYVAMRVWQSLSNADPIDVYPLLRPFAIGFAIMFFPTLVLGTINGVMSPVVKGAHSLLESQTFDMNEYRMQRDQLEQEAMSRYSGTAHMVDNEEFDKQLEELGILDAPQILVMYGQRMTYQFEKWVQNALKTILELLFHAAALIIDTLRTFFLVVLSILGPIAFGISVWSGFQASMTQWITRYVSVYLWLPVSDLFSSILAKIQVLMYQRDLKELTDPNFIPDGYNSVYIVFLLIGIIGYFTIPTVSNWIIQAGGMGNYGKNVNSAASRIGGTVTGTAGAGLGNITGRLFK